MEYRFSKDPLFGKYCYIDTPWIAGKNTIYRIVNSGVRSNTWCEVPVTGRTEQVIHNYSEDIVFVVLDTLIDEYSRIMRFALKDIVLVDTPQTTLQTTLCRECDDYAGDGMYCASNYLVRDFSTSAENCKANCIDKAKADIAERSSWSKTYEAMCEPQTDCGWGKPE